MDDAARILQLSERIEELSVALARIAEWGDAYPETMFPLCDASVWNSAHDTMRRYSSISLDRLAADCMRHVVQGVARIAREALGTE